MDAAPSASGPVRGRGQTGLGAVPVPGVGPADPGPDTPAAGPTLRQVRERVREETARAIREEAWRQLDEGGLEGLSLRAVARSLGVVSSAVYRYYPSRRDLLGALADDARASLLTAAAAAAASPGGGTAGAAHAVRDWARAHPHAFELLAGAPPHPDLLARLLPGPRPLLRWSLLLGLLHVDRLPGSPPGFFAEAVADLGALLP
ncbi:TetR/AcrR family transcriptional regulator [Streptacidiphilus monticola]|uniref:TetR/AcrR family transcriptional regulator n=1 Tax=Streptacidiphilus monticola TaxID=2161674 RepID=A0ABW1FU81_9ACTN